MTDLIYNSVESLAYGGYLADLRELERVISDVAPSMLSEHALFREMYSKVLGIIHDMDTLREELKPLWLDIYKYQHHDIGYTELLDRTAKYRSNQHEQDTTNTQNPNP
jgi:hypothetical protein